MANGKAAWRTAQIVRDLFKSGDFLAEACGDKLDDRDSKLSKFSGRFALGLMDMIQMIEHFPDLKDWERGQLDIIRDKTCAELAKRDGKSAAKGARHIITQAEHDALKRKYRELQIRFQQLEEEVKTLRRIATRKEPAATR